jgi:hypothetical protein
MSSYTCLTEARPRAACPIVVGCEELEIPRRRYARGGHDPWRARTRRVVDQLTLGRHGRVWLTREETPKEPHGFALEQPMVCEPLREEDVHAQIIPRRLISRVP